MFLVLQIGLFIGSGILLFLLWRRYRQNQSAIGDSLPTLLSKGQENLTAIAAVCFFGASLFLSINFAIELAFSFNLILVFTIMFIGFFIVEFNSTAHLSKGWNQGNVGDIILGTIMLVGGFCISIMAGQGMLYITEKDKQQEGMQKSDAYQAFIAQREQANAEAQALLVPTAQLVQAQNDQTLYQTQLATLQEQQQMLKQKLAKCPEDYFGNCINPTTAKLEQVGNQIIAVQTEMAAVNNVLQQHERYLKAKAVADKLNASQPEAVGENSSGVQALSIVLGVGIELVEAYTYFILAILCEFYALACSYLWQKNRYQQTVVRKTSVNNEPVINDNAKSNTKHNLLEQDLSKFKKALGQKLLKMDSKLTQTETQLSDAIAATAEQTLYQLSTEIVQLQKQLPQSKQLRDQQTVLFNQLMTPFQQELTKLKRASGSRLGQMSERLKQTETQLAEMSLLFNKMINNKVGKKALPVSDVATEQSGLF